MQAYGRTADIRYFMAGLALHTFICYDILATIEFCYFTSIIICSFRQGIFYYFCISIVFDDCFQLISINGFYQLVCWLFRHMVLRVR